MNKFTHKARQLRRQQTTAEAVLWQFLKAKRCGRKFVRQKPIIYEQNDRKKCFIADFYCRQARLVIEVDGESHEGQKEYDRLRTEIINSLGIRVIRFTNEQVIYDTKNVLEEIKIQLDLSCA